MRAFFLKKLLTIKFVLVKLKSLTTLVNMKYE